MNLLRPIFIAFALSLGAIAPALAQDLQKGRMALLRGDFATALSEFRLLAEQGDAEAQYELGRMYERGRGVPEDDNEAVSWYRLAAEQGNALAQISLGIMYENGDGMPKDVTEAVRWYRLAAEQGDALGQTLLGLKYDNGEGITEDRVSAYMWWNLTVAQGMEGARSYKKIVAEKMTREQIAEAQRLSRRCLARNYKGC